MTTKQIQHLLAFLGLYAMEVDGLEGPETVKGIREFQKAWGRLEVDGIAGVQTQSALRQAVAQGWQAREEKTGSFWEDIRYFTREEFRCRCGGCGGFPAEPEERLVRLAEELRGSLGQPVTVSSGVRCPAHNRRVGGVENSRHLTGKAMDFSVRGLNAAGVLSWLRGRRDVRYAYAIDESFVHMDVE